MSNSVFELKKHVVGLWIRCVRTRGKTAYFMHSISTVSTERINKLLNRGFKSTIIKHSIGVCSTQFLVTFNRLVDGFIHCFHTAYNYNYLYIKKG